MDKAEYLEKMDKASEAIEFFKLRIAGGQENSDEENSNEAELAELWRNAGQVYIASLQSALDAAKQKMRDEAVRTT